MKLTVTIPTRGRPSQLAQALDALTRNTEDKANTHIVIGFDIDDVVSMETGDRFAGDFSTIVTMERPLSLGEKYNILAAAAPADAYVQHADDQIIETPGWDRLVREALETFITTENTATERTAGIIIETMHPGLVYFGLGAGTMPANTVVNATWIEATGYMFPPYFPQWWHETWLDEVGWLTGRILWVPEIACRGIAPERSGRGKTKSLRDLAFWAEFFQRTRPLRVAQAQSILDAGPDPAYRLRQLAHQATQLYPWFRDREAQFAMAANNTGIIEQMAEPLEAGDAARLDRARAAAEALLKEKGL